MSEGSLERTAALTGVETVSAAAPVSAPVSVARRRKKVSPFTWLVYVYLVIMSIFALFPVFFVVQASLAGAQNLYTTSLQLLPVHATLDNYPYIFQHLPTLNWIVNTFFVTGLATLFGLALSTTAAYALSRFRFRGRQMTLVFLLSLQAFPGLLALLGYFQLLSFLHLTADPSSPNSSTISLLGLALVFSSLNITIGAWNMRGYFDSLPAELEQAALVDGATPTQAFLRVALPLAVPALAATAMLMFISMWNEFAISNIILNSNPTGSNLTFALGIQSLQSDYRVPWGYFAAASVTVSAPLMAVFWYAQRFFKSGLTIGSVKG
jgi:arabinogalactan oligomer / maltooligosaccharide transport system permease protein